MKILTLLLFLTSNALAFDVVGSLPQGLGDGRYVLKAGDTMSGPLTLNGSSLTVTGNAFSVGGSTLVVTGGIISGAGQPAVSAYIDSGQAILDSTLTQIWFGVEAFDRQNMHSVTVASGTFTIPVGGAGIYLLSANVDLDGNSTGVRNIQIYKNGGYFLARSYFGLSGVNASCTITQPVSLSAGDTIQLYVYQTSGITLNARSNSVEGGTHLSLVKLW